jgi:hypothetical protein
VVRPGLRLPAPAVVAARPRRRFSSLLHGATGRVECWDGLVDAEPGGAALVRLVRSEHGDLDITHELALGGFDLPWATWSATAALVGGTRVQVQGGASRLLDGRWLHTRVVAPARSWAALVIATRPVPHAPVEELAARLRAAEEDARGLLAGVRLPRHHPERAAEALAVLDACTTGRPAPPRIEPGRWWRR